MLTPRWSKGQRIGKNICTKIRWKCTWNVVFIVIFESSKSVLTILVLKNVSAKILVLKTRSLYSYRLLHISIPTSATAIKIVAAIKDSPAASVIELFSFAFGWWLLFVKNEITPTSVNVTIIIIKIITR